MKPTNFDYLNILFWIFLLLGNIFVVQSVLNMTVNNQCVAWNNFNEEHELRCDITQQKEEGRIDIVRGFFHG
jgi:regulatory protein YycI of two-component signal transduction system YycFG